MDADKRPIPTNHWWTDMVVHRFGSELWAYPLMVKTDPKGIKIFYPNRWNNGGNDMVREFPLSIGADGFQPADARAKEWGDWTLTFREAESDARTLDVTLGRGLPYVWIECHGLHPTIQLPADATLFDRAGAVVSLPSETDVVGIECGGRCYGLFAPARTRFVQDGKIIRADFPAADGCLVVSPLLKRTDLAAFYPYAFAIPRGSHLNWSYDPDKGEVLTTWQLTTEPFQGTEHALIQGWLPHHYRDTVQNLPFNGMEYLTPRGTMKCSVGTEFRIVYPFQGFLPMLPAPEAMGLPHDFNEARMRDYLARYSTRTDYGGDTYWGGKSLVQLGDYMLIAHEMGDPSFGKLKETLRKALVDWFTYTPGEKEHFFARYPNWRALIGFNSSYGSEEFNDNHFHYGYFTTASALLGMFDPEFLKDYGPMARQVAKEYANWDRSDLNFPFMRTFEAWEGHSWAGGFSSPTGNNQESSSEAMQSWGGLFLLGQALGDREMEAAGAMGYAMESRAALEYWFNIHGDNFSPAYPHPIAGMVWSGGIVYGTYFSGDPAWIWGIQWLPMSPILSYLVKDPGFAAKSFHAMLAERKKTNGTDAIAGMGAALGNVVMGEAQQVNPDWAVEQMDALWDAKDPIARDNDTPGLTYFQAHANRLLGGIQWDYHASIPTSMVYRNERTKTISTVIANMAPSPKVATVYHGTRICGTLLVPGQTVIRATTLVPPQTGSAVIGSLPAKDEIGVSRFLNTVMIAFSGGADPATLSGVKIRGPGAPTLAFQPGDDPQVAVFHIAGRLRPSGRYEVTAPRTARTKRGPLEADSTWSFTVEPQPPLAVVDSDPGNGKDHVPLDTRQMELTFNAEMDPASLTGVRLSGNDAGTLQLVSAGANGKTLFNITGHLSPDETYTVTVPASVKSVDGDHPAGPTEIHFSAAPPPCPPNVYAESFAGGGIGQDASLQVDMHNAESPHSGKYAIKISAKDHEGMLYLFAGTSDHAPGRSPLDLSGYKSLEFWIKGDEDNAWIKIGHPVFDNKAFHLEHITGITNQYRRYIIDLPSPKTEINTILGVSVAAGKTIWLDDVRFVK